MTDEEPSDDHGEGAAIAPRSPAGWDAGAAGWPLDKRIAFVSDIASKMHARTESDSGVDTYLPSNAAFGCDDPTCSAMSPPHAACVHSLPSERQ